MFVPCLSLISISSYVVQGTKETGNINYYWSKKNYLFSLYTILPSDILKVSEKDRKILDIESDLYEVKRQLQDAVTSSEAEVKLIQLKVDQMTRENEEIRAQKRELDAALRKLQAENAQAVNQVSALFRIL